MIETMLHESSITGGFVPIGRLNHIPLKGDKSVKVIIVSSFFTKSENNPLHLQRTMI